MAADCGYGFQNSRASVLVRGEKSERKADDVMGGGLCVGEGGAEGGMLLLAPFTVPADALM